MAKFGENNKMYVSNCRYGAGLLKQRLRKRRGVSRGQSICHAKPFQCICNHHHFEISRKFVATVGARQTSTGQQA